MAKSISSSFTPPLTPEISENTNDDALDYMDFLNSEVELKENDESNFDHLACREEEQPLLFDCKGETEPKGSLRENSFLSLRFLDNLLNEGTPLKNFAYHKSLTFSIDILYENLQHCIMSLRKSVQFLEKNSFSFCQIDSVWDKRKPFEARKEVVDVLVGLSILLNDLSVEDDLNYIQTVILEIKELIKFLGPIHLLASHITNASSPLGNKCSSGSYHLFHLHLDVRWWCLAILHQIEWKYGKEILSDTNFCFTNELNLLPLNNEECHIKQSIFNQLLNVIIWDVFTLIERQTSKVSLLECFNIPSLPCTCIYELSLLVLHVVEWRHKYYNQKCFWSIVNSKLLNLLKLKSKISFYNDLQQTTTGLSFPPPVFKDVKLYIVWRIFTTIARLFQYDNLGFMHSSGIPINSELKMLRTLILRTTCQNGGSANINEENMRFYLCCCYSLLELWENEKEGKHSDWVVVLWDHFSKSLDLPFILKENNLEGFASLSKLPSKIIEQVKVLVDGKMEKSESSWYTFLRILGKVLKLHDKEWKILKSRVYLKFHSKRMAELNNVGLYNTTILFLTLAWAKDITVCTKLCQLLCDVPDDSSKKSAIVFVSLAATAYLLTLKNCHLQTVTETIEKKISSLVQFSLSADSVEKRDIGYSIVLLCNGLQEVMKVSSDLTLGQSNLYSTALSNFCSRASVIEQGSIISFLDVGLSKVMEATKHLHLLAEGTGLDLIETLWSNFQSFIKSQILSPNPPSNLGFICASLVLCASRFQFFNKLKSNINEVSGLFLFVIDNEIISDRVQLQFICRILKEKSSVEYLSKVCEKYDEKLVGCLLINMIENGSSDDVMAASEAIFSTPKLRELMSYSPACPFGAFEMLVQSLEGKFKSSNSFQDRVKFKEKAHGYTNSLDKHLQIFIKKTPFPNHLPQVMELVACIICHGSSLYYVKGKSDCLIAKLVSSVILPTSVYKLEKPLNSVWSDALSPIFPKVIAGIAALWQSSDNYILRCLKDIFTSYAHRFPFTSHPFVSVLGNKNLQNFQEIQVLFIDTLMKNFVTKSSCNLAHKQMAISLLLEILEKHKEVWWDTYCKIVFPLILDFILTLEDNHTKRVAMDLIRKILTLDEKYSSSEVVVEHIRKFVVSNMPWYSTKVFRILEVLSVLSRNTMCESLPGIAEAIKLTEGKRGSGFDQTLRKGYQSLTEKLKTGEDLLI